MSKIGFLAIVIMIITMGINSCKKANEYYTKNVLCDEANDSLNVYSKNISAILNTNCAGSGCHDANSKKDGVDLSTYANSKTAFNSEDALCSIYGSGSCKKMPPSGSLSAEDVHDLTCWVKNNYPQ